MTPNRWHGLTRRQFLVRVTVLAAAWGIDPELLAGGLAAASSPPDVATTMLQTVLQGSAGAGGYRTLTTGPGEPHVPRLDVLRARPSAGRAAVRRSLLYLGHLSDLHVMDAQSPARLEPLIDQDPGAWAATCHPQDPLTVHVLAAMVRSFADLRVSQVTGAPMAAAVSTGDSADMHSYRELRWYIDVLDGATVDPGTGESGRFNGVQAWSDAIWAYRPADPTGGPFGDHGFPRLPELLTQAVGQPVRSVGLPVPWFAVYGNHDTLMFGTFEISAQWRAFAVGGEKSYRPEATLATVLGGYAATGSPLQRMVEAVGTEIGWRPGLRSVPADAGRRLFEQRDFMVEHFTTAETPGPVGHGFTQHNLDSGETWWKTDLTPQVRAFGLDTCNQVAGTAGAVPDDQFQWLRTELAAAQGAGILVLIFSHHNSLTLDNRAQRPGENQVLHDAGEFVDLLLDHPVVIGWLNGHTHLNQILAHTRATGGFWEITTASCIDFPQQQQVVEVVDNRDGTLSLFTTVVDHAGPVAPGTSGSYLDLAARSRELAANDWAADPSMRRGSPLDRNTELLLPTPFDLSSISDAALESQQAAQRARLLAYEARAPR